MPTQFTIRLTQTAQTVLAEIKDRRVRNLLKARIDGLVLEPEKQGKPLSGDLLDCRSVRAVGQRYRILYKVQEKTITVYVVLVGIRKEGDKRDVYTIAAKMAAQGLLTPPEEMPKG